MKAIKQIETPCEMPNGLQWTDEGLFVMDQLTDNVYVVDETGKLLRTINTPTANGSGITVGGGYLWTASNGESASRPRRSTDTGLGSISKPAMQTGEAVDRSRTPDGGRGPGTAKKTNPGRTSRLAAARPATAGAGVGSGPRTRS